jgi:hypothetical protein
MEKLEITDILDDSSKFTFLLPDDTGFEEKVLIKTGLGLASYLPEFITNKIISTTGLEEYQSTFDSIKLLLVLFLEAVLNFLEKKNGVTKPVVIGSGPNIHYFVGIVFLIVLLLLVYWYDP